MNISPPPLSENTDFRRMAVVESGGVYRFKLTRSAIFTLRGSAIPIPQRLSFRTSGKEWMRVEPHRIIISGGYAWNGNSVKKGVRILGRDVWLGTPDFDPGTLAASLIHDALFQYSFLREMPFSCAQANDFYAQICKANHFKLTGIYRSALDEFSHAFWGKFQSETTCHEI